eukprot:2901542-Amphidinium_carterae.1
MARCGAFHGHQTHVLWRVLVKTSRSRSGISTMRFCCITLKTFQELPKGNGAAQGVECCAQNDDIGTNDNDVEGEEAALQSLNDSFQSGFFAREK